MMCTHRLVHAHTYHKDESAKTLCQGLAKEQVADLEEPGQFVQIELVSSHVFSRERLRRQ